MEPRRSSRVPVRDEKYSPVEPKQRAGTKSSRRAPVDENDDSDFESLGPSESEHSSDSDFAERKKKQRQKQKKRKRTKVNKGGGPYAPAHYKGRTLFRRHLRPGNDMNEPHACPICRITLTKGDAVPNWMQCPSCKDVYVNYAGVMLYVYMFKGLFLC